MDIGEDRTVCFASNFDMMAIKDASNKAKMDKIDAKAKKIIDYGVI